MGAAFTRKRGREAMEKILNDEPLIHHWLEQWR